MKKSKRGSGVILGVIGIYLMLPLLFSPLSTPCSANGWM